MSSPSPQQSGRPLWVWAVPALLALVLLAGFVVTLAQSKPRLTGSNSVPLGAPVVGLGAGERACQAAQLVPEGSERMRIFLAPAKTEVPQALVTLTTPEDGRLVRVRGRYDKQGFMEVTVPRIRETRLNGEVCVKNEGSQTFVLDGTVTRFGNVRVGAKHLEAALTVLWYGAKPQSSFAILGDVAARVGHARLTGAWPFWAATLLVLLAGGLALVTAIRAASR